MIFFKFWTWNDKKSFSAFKFYRSNCTAGGAFRFQPKKSSFFLIFFLLQPIVIIIFCHFIQVGGHTRLLLLNQSTVIKPLNIRELDFYQNIPSDIQAFVPKYKGESESLLFTAKKSVIPKLIYLLVYNIHS